MNYGLADRVIVVTGGRAGIGAAIVAGLAAEGAVPVVLDRDATADFSLDLTDEAACGAAISTIAARYRRIDGLVNNAGVNDGAGLDAPKDDQGDDRGQNRVAAFRLSLERNLIHYYVMMMHCLPHLRRAPGGRASVVNIASKVALTGQGRTSGYAAAKGGQLALTREWAAELAAEGIRVNAVVPAEVDTPMYRQWLESFPDPAVRRGEITRRIPLGARMTTPEEIAASVVFLLSDAAAHITGQWHSVDGGYVHLDRALAADGR